MYGVNTEDIKVTKTLRILHRNSRSQMFFQIGVIRKISQEYTCIGVSFL